MVRSRLLDKGREYVDVYPEVIVTDSRGTPTKVASTTPVRVRVTTTIDRSQVADLQGQIDVYVLRCIARTAPVGTWAKVIYNGHEYDLAAPPRFTEGVSKATKHVEFVLRSRSGLGRGNG